MLPAATNAAQTRQQAHNHKPIPPRAHLEQDATAGCLVGKVPRNLSGADLEAMGRPRVSRGDAIRAKCLDCVCGVAIEVKRCGMLDCALWPFRMGTDPYRAEMSDERKQAARERFSKARAA